MPDLTEVQLNKLNLELRKSRKKSLTVTDSRIHGFLVGARQLVRQDGGRAAHFTVRNRCNLPRLCAPTGDRLQKSGKTSPTFPLRKSARKYLRADHLRLHTETLVSSRLSGR